MKLEDELKGEIKKWTAKLDSALPGAKPADARGDKLLTNIRAYGKDSRHFFEKNDIVKSFECLIWAWALLETGKELGHIEVAKRPVTPV
ncbi:MAG: DUF357 domain-containing protein [Candidatus Hadarchaeota archaeon]